MAGQAVRRCKYGEHVAIDADRIRRLMAELDIESGTLAAQLGLSRDGFTRLLRSGSVGVYRLDEIACALGVHYHSLMLEEVA